MITFFNTRFLSVSISSPEQDEELTGLSLPSALSFPPSFMFTRSVPEFQPSCKKPASNDCHLIVCTPSARDSSLVTGFSIFLVGSFSHLLDFAFWQIFRVVWERKLYESWDDLNTSLFCALHLSAAQPWWRALGSKTELFPELPMWWFTV